MRVMVAAVVTLVGLLDLAPPPGAGRRLPPPQPRPAANQASSAMTPVGHWKTIDDKTGKPRSIVKIWEQDGALVGRIEKLIREPGEDPDPVCDKCKGEKHDERIIGMEFLWGFERRATGWGDGWVLDPDEGNVYHGNLEVQDGGSKLKLFGYIRIIFKIGRSQTWQRVRPEDWGLAAS